MGLGNIAFLWADFSIRLNYSDIMCDIILFFYETSNISCRLLHTRPLES